MKNYIIIFSLLLLHYNTFGQIINYETEIQPIFSNSCMPCHSGNNPGGGLDLTSYENVMAGNDDGPVITIGDYENSILWQEVSSGDMPTDFANNTWGIADLNSTELELIENWILDLQCMVMDCEGECALGECIEDNTSLLESKKNKKIVKILDILGKEKTFNHQDILLYIYDDGTIEKRIHVK